VLLDCGWEDDHAMVLERLRRRLSQQQAVQLAEVDVDSIQDVVVLQRLLREAQMALGRLRA
jgi:hypothetical protein